MRSHLHEVCAYYWNIHYKIGKEEKITIKKLMKIFGTIANFWPVDVLEDSSTFISCLVSANGALYLTFSKAT
jgi:hypothetical protein